MASVTLLQSPVIQSLLTTLRDKETPRGPGSAYYAYGLTFSSQLLEMVIGANSNIFPTREVSIHTPLCGTTSLIIDHSKVMFVAVLRAGVVFTDAAQCLLPGCQIGFIDLHRDEKDPANTIEGKFDYLPDRLDNVTAVLVDPMVATGNTVKKAATMLKARGASRVIAVGWIGCPEGIDTIHEAHPDVDIFLAAVDECLNAAKFIDGQNGGAGDVGDNLLGPRPKTEEEFVVWLRLHMPRTGMSPHERMMHSLLASLAPQYVAMKEEVGGLWTPAGGPCKRWRDERD